jgi:DNA polymerase-3 subunit delta'
VSARDQAGGAPDPDRLGDYPAPRETLRLFGHEDAGTEMLEAARDGRMPPAWLIAGPEGVGKATLAFAFARALLRHPDGLPSSLRLDDGGDDTVARQTASLAHPNLLLLRRSFDEKEKRFRQVIAVDEARKLRAFFAGAAGMRGWRIVIVDAADDLNDSSANALLKSVEEPPAQSVFLIVAHAPGRLPVTIRSRCRSVRLGPLGADDLARAVGAARAAAQESPLDPSDAEAAFALAQGSARRALLLLSADGIALYRAVFDLASRLPALDAAKAHALVDKLAAPAAAADFETAYGLLLDLIARLVRQAAAGQGAIGRERELAGRLIGGDALARWAELWETLSRAKAEADALNLPKRTLLLNAFFRLQETAAARAA